MAVLTDIFGRKLDYLRISLTDKCNLRCLYCMPKEGVKRLSHAEILTLEEIERLAEIMVGLGIQKIRLTGGEPLIRKSILELVGRLREIPDLKELSLTTNGTLLGEYAEKLKEAGLDAVNLSLDTLQPDRFLRLTGEDMFREVRIGIEACQKAKLHLKLNCVPIIGINDEEIEAIAAFAQETGVTVRFIELMPLGCGALFTGLDGKEILRRLENKYGSSKRLDPCGLAGEQDILTGPAELYTFEHYTGTVGLIRPLSHQFCDRCNRLRLTAEGYLKLCLQYEDGLDLRKPLRSGLTNEGIAELIRENVKRKPAAHQFQKAVQRDHIEERKMVQIGG